MNKRMVILIAFVSFVLIPIIFLAYYTRDKSEIGTQAVKYLYEFGSTQELDKNMDKLNKITTKSVYNQLTIDNVDRALNTYLKFKNKPCEVQVIKATDSYILYTLKTDALSSGRKFIFTFETDWRGRIKYVREAEVIDFYKTNN